MEESKTKDKLSQKKRKTSAESRSQLFRPKSRFRPKPRPRPKPSSIAGPSLTRLNEPFHLLVYLLGKTIRLMDE
jgi:hypothetical protein